jgi:four helix bundle protein
MNTPTFDHEKLDVYQRSIEFVAFADLLIGSFQKPSAVRDQLDRASISIPLNIAEGNGRFTSADRCRFFDTARGSALECAAALDVCVAKRLASQDQILKGKELLSRVVSMLVRLISSNSPDRVHEDAGRYDVD